jgi:hypothetical protein
MTWPTSDVSTTNVDAPADSPALARSEFLDLFTKFNQVRTHVSSFMQTILGRTSGGLVRGDIGAAASGANTDITSIQGNPVAQGYSTLTSTNPRQEFHNNGVAASQFRLLADGSLVAEQSNGSGAASGVAEFIRLGRAYLQHKHPSVAKFEWHVPGFGARLMTLDSSNIFRLYNSDGAGNPISTIFELTAAGSLNLFGSYAANGVAIAPLGVGQTWHATSTRGLNVTYTNTSGRAQMHVANLVGAAGAQAIFYVNGLPVEHEYFSSGAGNISALVPNGNTFQVSTPGGGLSLINWYELS